MIVTSKDHKVRDRHMIMKLKYVTRALEDRSRRCNLWIVLKTGGIVGTQKLVELIKKCQI